MTGGSKPLSAYRGLLLDLHGTVMLDADRLKNRDLLVAHPRWRAAGGHIPDTQARRWFDDTLDLMARQYEDPTHWAHFPSLAEAFRRVAPEASRDPTLLNALVDTVAAFEHGTVPAAHAQAVKALARTHALAVVSNIWAPKARWVAELERAGILSCFDALVFSSDGRAIKPRPHPFRAAAAALDLSPVECLMIGDDPFRDGYGARQAGMDVLIVGGVGAPSLLDLPATVSI